MDELEFIAQWGTTILELIGIGIIVSVALLSLCQAIAAVIARRGGESVYTQLRHRLARAILLGLEFLVAADIINTVAVNLSFRKVGILAAIVLIRTFLSFSLEVEIEGRWPWQRHGRDANPGSG